MKNMDHTDKQEILAAINQFSTVVDQKFESIDRRFDAIDQRFNAIDQRFDVIESRINRIEATMVTKDYLDEKLADLRGDLVVLIRKEDSKFKTLVKILSDKNLISE